MLTPAARPYSSAPAGIAFAGEVLGLGGVFAKSLRDSRRATVIVAAWTCLLLVVVGATTASSFATPSTRAAEARLASDLPQIILGLYGGPAPNVGTLGGLASWRYGLMFLLVPGVWSLLALSGALAGEARRGSLELVAAAPLSRRRIALEKLGAHVASLGIAMTVFGFTAWLVGQVFATLPGDTISPAAAFGYALYAGLVALATGAIAFALAPLLGRGAAAGAAAAVLFASWFINGYRDAIPTLRPLRPLSWFSWTLHHKPLAGSYDWPSLLPLAAIIVVGFAVGVLAFERRDLAAFGVMRLPGMPPRLRGTRGPLARSLSERLPAATGWGLGLATLALFIAASGDSLQRSLTENQAVANLVRAAFPTLDLASPGLGLQLAFLAFGYVGMGFAATTLLAGWGSDEGEGRLDLVLAAPLTRVRWLLRSALGVYAAIVLVGGLVALAIVAGVAVTGADVLTPALGAAVLVLHGVAIAGVGVAGGGLAGPSLAAPVAAAVTVGTLLLDLIVPALKLPDWLHQLALTAHFGEPMVGHWDALGIAVALAVAAGGLALGVWGFARRDLRS